MKLKIGVKVKIKSRIYLSMIANSHQNEFNSVSGNGIPYFNRKMLDWCGKTVEIRSSEKKYGHYSYQVWDNSWTWGEDWLETSHDLKVE